MIFGQIFLKMAIVGGTGLPLPTFADGPSFWQLKRHAKIQPFLSVLSWLFQTLDFVSNFFEGWITYLSRVSWKKLTNITFIYLYFWQVNIKQMFDKLNEVVTGSSTKEKQVITYYIFKFLSYTNNPQLGFLSKRL